MVGYLPSDYGATFQGFLEPKAARVVSLVFGAGWFGGDEGSID